MAALLGLLTAPACTNNFMSDASQLINTNGEDAPPPDTGSGSGIVLSRVRKNPLNPDTTFDLLGDGSHAFGEVCTPKTGGTAGATTCTCAFSYITSDGSVIGPLDVETTYSEQDMVRCPYETLPPNLAYVKVALHVTNSDDLSNEVTFNFASSGATADLSNPSSYSLVQRYQCRDIVTIPYLFNEQGETLYDPLLSEDPKYSYPLNFYTTNMGKTLALYAAGDTGAGVEPASTIWNCPSIPNDTAAGLDLTVYSVAADSTGSKAIYPPTGAFDRSTFHIAKTKAGVFNVPVNAYVFPGQVTQTQTSSKVEGVPPLGYAARPVMSGGVESCPDSSVHIPTGYHWAKLWLFRASLPKRTYPTSARLRALGKISCNPGQWTGAGTLPSAPNDGPFPDCSGSTSLTNLSGSTTGYPLAARMLEGAAICVNPLPGQSTNPSTQLPYNNTTDPHYLPPYNLVDFSYFAPGSDIWVPGNQDPVYGCGGSAGQVNDHAHVCDSTMGHVPYDSTTPVTTGEIDTSVATSRFDFLFVVTPPSVTRADMDPTGSGSTHSVYTPIRYMSPGDCSSPDPDNPLTPGDCHSSRLIRYGLKKHEVGSGGNPGQDDANRPGDFPLCVLQPD